MSKPVIIAGAGIIGCLLGHVLKKYNIPFKILEKSTEFKKIPHRTVALTKESIHFLNSIDKSLDLNKWTTPVTKMELYHKNELGIVLDSNTQEKVTSIGLLSELHKKLLKKVENEIIWNSPILNIINNDQVIVKTPDKDFETAMKLSDVYLSHGLNVFETINNREGKLPLNDEKWINSLPINFSTEEAIKNADKLGIKERTVYKKLKKYVDDGLVKKKSLGLYKKIKLFKNVI